MVVILILLGIALVVAIIAISILVKSLEFMRSDIADIKQRLSERGRDITKTNKTISNMVRLLDKQSDLMTESSQMISHMYTNRMFLDVEEFGAYVVRSNQLINNLVEAEEYEKANECKKSLEKAIEEFKNNNPHVEFIEIRKHNEERGD